MPGKEKAIPDWAAKERGADLAWVGENTHVLWPAAQGAFVEMGRGAIIVDTSTVVRQGSHIGNPMYYLAAAQIEEHAWLHAIKMVREYDPSWEFVAVLLKGKRESVYRIGIPAEKK